jgi:hypothetical protein
MLPLSAPLNTALVLLGSLAQNIIHIYATIRFIYNVKKYIGGWLYFNRERKSTRQAMD